MFSIGSTPFPGTMVNEITESSSFPTRPVLSGTVTFTVKYCVGKERERERREREREMVDTVEMGLMNLGLIWFKLRILHM